MHAADPSGIEFDNGHVSPTSWSILNPQRLLAGVEINGVWVVEDAGQHWSGLVLALRAWHIHGFLWFAASVRNVFSQRPTRIACERRFRLHVDSDAHRFTLAILSTVVRPWMRADSSF